MDKSPKTIISRFDEMSTEALKDILYQDFLLQKNGEYSADEILYISGLVAAREKTITGADYPDSENEWDVFIEKYLPSAGEVSLYGDEGSL